MTMSKEAKREHNLRVYRWCTENKICVQCKKAPRTHGIRCQPCRDHYNQVAKEKRAKHKAKQVCIECKGPAFPGIRCEYCAHLNNERTKASRQRRPRTPEYEAKRAIYLAKKRAYAAERRMAFKIEGACTRCGEPACDDNNFCPKHRQEENAGSRERARTRRQRRKEEVACSTPSTP